MAGVRMPLSVAELLPSSYGLGFPPPVPPGAPPLAPPAGAGADEPGVLMSIRVVLVRCIPPPNTNQPMIAKRIRTTMAQIHPEPEPLVGVCWI
jgi:hypothetical protein